MITAEHLPGIQNVQADTESRKMRNTSNWMLNREIFKQINQKYGSLEIDLFADRLNACTTEELHTLASQPIFNGDICISDNVEHQEGLCFPTILPKHRVFLQSSERETRNCHDISCIADSAILSPTFDTINR
jgi:hypothetical protein